MVAVRPAALALLVLLAAQLGAFSGQAPANLGVRDGRLQAAVEDAQQRQQPGRPVGRSTRCRTTRASRRWRCKGSGPATIAQIRRIVEAMPGATGGRAPRRLPLRAVHHALDEVRRRRRVLVRPGSTAWCRCARPRASGARTSASTARASKPSARRWLRGLTPGWRFAPHRLHLAQRRLQLRRMRMPPPRRLTENAGSMSAAPVHPPSAAPGAYTLPWPVVRAQLLRGAGYRAAAVPGDRAAAGRHGARRLRRRAGACRCCIGLCCWLLIDGGRHLLARAAPALRGPRRGLGADLPVGFPGWPWMAAAGRCWA